MALQGTKWDQNLPLSCDGVYVFGRGMEEIGDSIHVKITNEKNSIWSKNCTGWKMGEGSDLQHHMNVFNQIISDLARL